MQKRIMNWDIGLKLLSSIVLSSQSSQKLKMFSNITIEVQLNF